MIRRHACVTLAALGGVLGLAVTAWGQEMGFEPSAVPVGTMDPAGHALIEALKGLGLPGVLAWLGWSLGRSNGIPIRVVADEKLVEAIDRHGEAVRQHGQAE